MAWNDTKSNAVDPDSPTASEQIQASEWNAMVADQESRLSEISEDSTPQLGGDLDAQDNNITGAGTIGFTQELDNGTKSSSFTVNFADDQKQKVTLTSNTMTITLSASRVGNYLLKVVNGGLATITWSSVLWPEGTEPTWTSSGTDILSLYYDGTNFYGVGSVNFS